jgi:diguanylate cyclase (GGDEF)-like protein
MSDIPFKENILRDPLTGTYSRASLKSRVEEEIERARRYGYAFSLLLLDIDHFKSINDAFGHMRGDQVLIEFVQRIEAMARSIDILFRLGGDEFIYLLPNTDNAQAVYLAQRLLAGCRATLFAGEPPLSLTFSTGVATFPSDGQSEEKLVAVADERNYQAKRAGRCRVVGEEQPPVSSRILVEPSRLIERDQAIETLQRFLGALPELRRGILTASGPAGSGKSRFLTEASRAARMQGYAVLELCGKAALTNRLYGVWVEARYSWQGPPIPSTARHNFISALHEMISREGHQGLVIILDNLPEVDHATLAFVQNLFFSAGFPQVALVFTTSSPETYRGLPQEAPLRSSVSLEPLSQAGVRIWLRQSLHWEPSTEFSQWFHQQTGGLPDWIQQGLKELVESEVLKFSDNQWLCQPDFRTFSLSDTLKRKTSGPPHNLPSSLTDFVGREDEIICLRQLLQEHRLVTLVGPGGMGKTRLALQAAAESRESFPNGVFFVPLAALSSTDFLISAIADALNFSFSGPQDAKTQVINHLRDKEMLLVLDSFEHLSNGTPLLEDILKNAPQINMLITSRQHLGLPGETCFELGSLPLPSSEAEEGLEDYSVVQLFLLTARRVKPDFILTETEMPFVMRICRLVEGMPLGIEFAAAWVQAFTCQEIAALIESNLAFLASDRPDIPSRQRSLLAVFDSFWNLLSKDEQKILGWLSIFRGGFSVNAAEYVARASPFFLDALVAHTYLHRTTQGRYEMHEFLRQYSADKLKSQPAQEIIGRDRHCTFYADFLRKRKKRLRAEKQVLDEINVEIENLRVAWRWAIEHANLRAIAHMRESLSCYYDIIGLYQEGLLAFETAVIHLESHPVSTTEDRRAKKRLLSWLLSEQSHFLNSLAIYDQSIAVAQIAGQLSKSEQDQGGQAISALRLGCTLRARGAYELALVQLNSALSLSQAAHLTQTTVDSLIEIGDIALTQGDHHAALVHYKKALSTCRRTGDRRGEGNALKNLGVISKNQGAYKDARTYFEQALRIFQEVGERRNEGWAMTNLGLTLEDLGIFPEARTYFELALPIYREVGDRPGETWGLNTLGYFLHVYGRHSEAWTCFADALRICREIGDRWGENISLSNLGNVLMAIGRYPQAREQIELALQISREIGDRWGEIWRLSELGMAFHHLGDDLTSCQYNQQALLMTEDTGDRPIQGFALTRLGHAQLGLGQYQEAVDTYQQAVELRREFGSPNMLIESLAGMANALLAQRKAAQAQAHVETILHHLEKRTLDGTEEPLKVYLICYQILHTRKDYRAPRLLKQAYELLNTRAALIYDDDMRRSYLENVPAHREIITACHDIL